jgi:hypothetical protein
MHHIDDPYINAARTLALDLKRGLVTKEQYDRMYPAIVRAAEADNTGARPCAGGCGRLASVIQRGLALCAVCALLDRSQRRPR